MRSLYLANLREHLELFATLEPLAGSVADAAEVAIDTLRNGRKIMLCGNGGSAADSQHIAAELTGRFNVDRKPLAAMALGTESASLTSIGNDYAFKHIFERQLRGLGQPGDCLIGISTSGNSENVMQAFMAAREMGISTIGLLGRDGGKLLGLCDHSIVVPSHSTPRIQEAHMLIGHTICGLIEQGLGLVDIN
jgi:D-sedoheptulose 7-phosphate isomerase